MGGFGGSRPAQTVVQTSLYGGLRDLSAATGAGTLSASRVTAERDPGGSLSTEELLRRYSRAQDPAVLEEIVRRFEPLARSVARRYAARGEPLEDLTQVAMVGLLKAISRFDPDRGFAFTSYATPTMLGELKRYFRDSGWAVHVPRGVKERALELASATEELSSRLGRSPSLSELAEALEATEEETLEAIEAYHARHATPLEHGADDEEAGVPQLANVLGAEDERLEQAEYLTMIAKGVETLSESDRLILYLRFARDLTQSEIASRIGTSQMQVSRLLRAAIEKIRRVSGEVEEPGQR
jgi:RNA polymerase sigma-B factor